MGDTAARQKEMAKSAGGLASRRLLIGVALATAFALLLSDAHLAVGQRSALPVRRGFTSKGLDRSPPSRPTDLAVASVMGDRLLLSWDASTDNVGVAGYDVFRNGAKMTTVTTTSASRTGRLSCGRSYVYGVLARDAAGNASKRGRLRISTSACAAAPTARPYFVVDYSNGAIGAPWTTSFSDATPGFTDLTQSGPTTGTADGRVKVVPAPSGSGYAARFELRDSDPGWPSNPDVQKAEVRTDTGPTFNKSAVAVGDVRWFSTRIYLPYNATEKFEWAHGGSQPYTSLWGLHPQAGGNAYGAIHLGWEAWQVNAGDKNMWLNFHVEGGTFPETTYSKIVNLVQLTDGSGNRIMANHNRWIDLVWGMRFAPDNTGWLEVWVDGVNVYPRKNRPTMWAGDTGEYFKYGLYKKTDASFPETGRSVVYFGRTTIGLTKP